MSKSPDQHQHSDPHQQFMRRAITLSRENVSQRNGGPFGAVIVKDGKIIGEGFNRVTASNALSPARFYQLPPNRVVELGTQITI